MLRLNEEHQRFGNGLGYQMTAYAIMRTICDKKGLEYSANLHPLRNTFSGINIESIDPPGIQGEKSVEFSLDDSFDSICDKADDNVTLYGYPTPAILNTMDSSDFDKVKKHFEFRKEVYDRCLAWKNENFGDCEVISMHVRRFAEPDMEQDLSGQFFIGNDYYEKALELLPKDLPVLIFTNDKSYVLEQPNWDGNRFIVAPDMMTGRGSNKTDWHHLNKVLGDRKIGLSLDLSPEINSLYLNYMVDRHGDNEFVYSHAIQELKSHGYPKPPQCGQKCFETRKDCYRDKPDREFTKETRYKIEHNLYDYSFEMCLMSMCDYHIAANSLYGLWGIELSNTKKVIYPKYWMQGLHDDPEAIVCDDPESCRPGFKCNQDNSIVRDLSGFDQTAEFLGSWVGDNWVGLENPDQRVNTERS